MRMMFATLLAVAVAGCATTPAPPPLPTVPHWDAIPASLVQAFCARLEMDRVGGGGDLAIVKTTQPLVMPATMQALAQASHKKRGVNAFGAAEQITAGQVTLPLIVPTSGGCRWKPVDFIDPAVHGDVMVIELSSPFANPYVRNEAIILGRTSLGGSNPTWYRIPLTRAGTEWALGHITPLGVWQ